MKRLVLLLALLLAACAALAPAPAPRLVVLFIVDGLPYRQVAQTQDAFVPDGLRRFLREGTVFEQARYGHAYTVTAAGHATLLTGASPARHGIIGNEWRDPATGERVYCTADPAARYIGHATQPLDGTSPRLLQAETVGDVLRRVRPGAKVLAVSGKDRGAILPAGHAGTAYIAMADGRFASTTYYMPAHPAWVDAFRPPPGAGLDARTLAFARAAVAGEGLGRDAVPDLLVVSLSEHDAVNHRSSAESPQSRAHLLELDALLQDFLRALDGAVGRAHYAALLTADHGFSPSPSGRITGSAMVARVNAALQQRFGAAGLVQFNSASALVLDRRAGLPLDGLAAAARDALLQEPGIAAAATRSELAGSATGPFLPAMRRSWNAARSGDVQYVTRPGWMFGTAGATHGSPHEDDVHVPLLLWGPAWVAAGQRQDPVDMVVVAPTLAALLRVPQPGASEGRPL